MSRMSNPLPNTIAPIAAHIKTCFERHRSAVTESHRTPLFVAFQGPQGSGKTFLTSQIRAVLNAPPHNLSVAVLSIDDLYLPHRGLTAVAAAHPHNALLAGRGQPGTHDVSLGTELLKELNEINGDVDTSSDKERAVRFPIFEKSLFDGQGDRVEDGVVVKPPLDVVLFEGWCVGFCPVNESEIDRRYAQPIPDLKGILDIQSFSKKNILEINAYLCDYVEWWSFFDAFVQVKPSESMPYSLIYKWRLQQEHNMKAKNGGKGMTDEQVKRFIDRYIPGYLFFSDGIEHGYIDKSGFRHLPRWLGNGLKVLIDGNRPSALSTLAPALQRLTSLSQISRAANCVHAHSRSARPQQPRRRASSAKASRHYGSDGSRMNVDEANGEYGCIVEDGREMYLGRCDECAGACNAKTLAQPAGPIEEGCEDGGVNGGSAENVPALSGCARAAGNVESAMDREYRTQRQTLA
ncbi:hypothetical protein EW145_g6294 [Phellinidium pouzarii]|uniref:P-loop containing nucleoside triphosphate hydrolase protein n=1 Tax=Phellinidium pouzarii TaxID=167371 RepID=A0A4S4KYU7_9AGAM|nr:hypothetical protein EW145_g6294 [Phellinidium pouzarii]